MISGVGLDKLELILIKMPHIPVYRGILLTYCLSKFEIIFVKCCVIALQRHCTFKFWQLIGFTPSPLSWSGCLSADPLVKDRSADCGVHLGGRALSTVCAEL